jgi:6-pyruvoyltetrahydropterin/6-carboxytetrahydropterin synthase
MYEQSYEFSFEAAHELGANVAETVGHKYSRLHGHSFVATVTLRAEALNDKRWIVDFAELKAACGKVVEALDHRLLNEIDGLGAPTLENIAAWIFSTLRDELPALYRVELARPTLRERVAYYSAAE